MTGRAVRVDSALERLKERDVLMEAPVRLALTRPEAAAALGISLDSFERYVQPEIRLIRRDRLRLVAVRELERWLKSNSARVIE